MRHIICHLGRSRNEIDKERLIGKRIKKRDNLSSQSVYKSCTLVTPVQPMGVDDIPEVLFHGRWANIDIFHQKYRFFCFSRT